MSHQSCARSSSAGRILWFGMGKDSLLNAAYQSVKRAKRPHIRCETPTYRLTRSPNATP